jgi:hypothetical protein
MNLIEDFLKQVSEEYVETICNVYFTEDSYYISSERMAISNLFDNKNYNYKLRYDNKSDKLLVDTLVKDSNNKIKTQTTSYNVKADKVKNIKEWVETVDGKFIRDGSTNPKDDVVYNIKRKLGLEEFPFDYDENEIAEENGDMMQYFADLFRQKEKMFNKMKHILNEQKEHVIGIFNFLFDSKYTGKIRYESIADNGRMATDAFDIYVKKKNVAYADILLANYTFKNISDIEKWAKSNGFNYEDVSSEDILRTYYPKDGIREVNAKISKLKLPGIGRLSVRISEDGKGFSLIGMMSKINLLDNNDRGSKEGFLAATQPGNNAGIAAVGMGGSHSNNKISDITIGEPERYMFDNSDKEIDDEIEELKSIEEYYQISNESNGVKRIPKDYNAEAHPPFKIQVLTLEDKYYDQLEPIMMVIKNKDGKFVTIKHISEGKIPVISIVVDVTKAIIDTNKFYISGINTPEKRKFFFKNIWKTEYVKKFDDIIEARKYFLNLKKKLKKEFQIEWKKFYKTTESIVDITSQESLKNELIRVNKEMKQLEKSEEDFDPEDYLSIFQVQED